MVKDKIFLVVTFRFIRVAIKKSEHSKPRIPIITTFQSYFGNFENKIFLVRTFRFIRVASKKSETFQTANSNYHNISSPIFGTFEVIFHKNETMTIALGLEKYNKNGQRKKSSFVDFEKYQLKWSKNKIFLVPYVPIYKVRNFTCLSGRRFTGLES
ncbi:hypothetical protein Avbf_12731 [Armadillidium vulgare]|nr:hypothetical protein Avbf_12731 [Armadillidium vulgare]